MNTSNLKSKSVNGIFWVTLEKFGKQGIQFFLGLIIARILSPEDYGIIGMLGVFMALSSAILDSGIGSALIQKKDRTIDDFSTAFLINIITGVILYGIMFFTAPLISSFYNEPLLLKITRVYSITLLLNSLDCVQKAKFSIDFNFKAQAIIYLISLTLSGVIGIILAVNGFGVWTLVFYSISESIIRVLLTYIYTRWIPLGHFTRESFKHIFSFGYKVLLTSILTTFYNNLYSLVIGKILHSHEVGIYNRSKNFSELPGTIFSQIFMRVAYPLFSEYQDDENRLRNSYFKILKLETYLLAPLLSGLFILSKPLILFVLKDKWSECINLLRILCIGAFWVPLEELNINILYSKGKTSTTLIFNIIEKVLAIAILVCTIPFGLVYMCIGRSVMAFISYIISCFFTKKQVNAGILDFLVSILRPLIQSAIMCLAIYLLCCIISSSFLQLIIGFIAGVTVYLGLGFITKSKIQQELVSLVLLKFRKKGEE